MSITDPTPLGMSLQAPLTGLPGAKQADAPAVINTVDSVTLSDGKKPPSTVPDLRGIFAASPVEDKKEIIAVGDMFITLTGSPGAGKSTHGKMLAARYGIPHISVGKILRKEVAEHTDLGRQVKKYVDSGDLAPTSLVSAVVKSRLSQPDCKNGFILDGFPRRLDDLAAFRPIMEDLGIKNFRMVGIDVNPDVVIDRMKNRRVCDNGHEYDLVQNPPKKEGVCDIDNLPIHQRDDDKPETIRHRFQVYREETLPVIDFYRKNGAFTSVDGNGAIDDVASRLTALLDPPNDKESE
jgi:adenylate kinase